MYNFKLIFFKAANMQLESFLDVLKTTNSEIKEYTPAMQAIDLWNKHLEECCI